MQQGKLNHLFSESDCLDEDLLFGYIDNKLTAKEKHLVELHILNCELCADAIDGIRFINSTKHAAENVNVINKNINHYLETKKSKKIILPIWFKYAVAAAILTLFVSLFFIKQQLNKSEDIIVAKSDINEADKKQVETPPPPPPVAEDKPSDLIKNPLEKKGEKNERILRKENKQSKKGLLDKLYLDKDSPEASGKAGGDANYRSEHLEQTFGWISDPKKDADLPDNAAAGGFAQTVVGGNTGSSVTKPAQNQKNLVTVTQEKKHDITKIEEQANTETLANNAFENKAIASNSTVNTGTDNRNNNYKESEKFQSTNSVSDEEISVDGVKGEKKSKKKDKVTSATTKSNQQAPVQTASGVSAAEVLNEDKSINEYNNALGYYIQKDFAKSAAAYEKILLKEPSNYDAQYFLASCYYNLKNFDKAIKLYTDLSKLKNGKHYADSKWYLSQALVEMKQTEQAKRILNEIKDEGGSYDIKAKQQLEKMK